MVKKKYQVFISSTYLDLIDERKIIHDALLLADYIPVEMEEFGSAGMNQSEYIHELLDQTDYYILIIAGKYGSINDEGVSYTEDEYNYAVSKNIPVIPFLIKDVNKLPRDKTENSKKRQKMLITFRKKVSSNVLVSFYEDKGELGTQVLASMKRAVEEKPRPGWIRADEANDCFTENISNPIDDDLKQLMKLFQKLAVDRTIMDEVHRGMTEKEIDYIQRWDRASNDYKAVLSSIKQKYEEVKLTISSNELFNCITELKEMVENAYFNASEYRNRYVRYRATGKSQILDEKYYKEYELLMKTIPQKYEEATSIIRKMIAH